MGGYELGSKYFLAFYKVAYICPGKAVLAGIAVAAVFYGGKVMLECGVAKHLFACAGKGEAVSCYAGLQHAVKHIHASDSAFDKAIRAAHAHKVTGFIFGHIGHKLFKHIVHYGFWLANGEAAYAIAGQIQRGKEFCALYAKVGIHIALNYAEKGLILSFMGFLAAHYPAMGTLHGVFGIFI